MSTIQSYLEIDGQATPSLIAKKDSIPSSRSIVAPIGFPKDVERLLLKLWIALEERLQELIEVFAHVVLVVDVVAACAVGETHPCVCR